MVHRKRTLSGWQGDSSDSLSFLCFLFLVYRSTFLADLHAMKPLAERYNVQPRCDLMNINAPGSKVASPTLLIGTRG